MEDKHLQVEIFWSGLKEDNTIRCNEFLKKIGSQVEDVKAEYNTRAGGVVYIVTYWQFL